MAKVKFSKQYIQPNPLEVDYWVDVSENPYGAVVKYHDGNDWQILNISEGGGSFPAYKYYTKEETNRLLSYKQDILDTSKFITEIPSEYITEFELNNKGYLTQHQDISHLATKEETNKIASDQKQYTDLEIAKLVNSAPETLDTLYELAEAIEENDTVIDALDSAITNKADKSDVEVEVEVEISNGVYAVTADGQLIDYNTADSSCIGVAFISANQKVMIAKADATNDGSNYNLYWGKNLLGKNVPNLANNDNDTAAMADYNGKSNTAAIIASYAAFGIEMDSRDMCKALETFNEGGYTDWYIPAAGQLYEFYSNITAINEALAVISGNAFSPYAYWSSSEKSIDGAWLVRISDGDVYYNSKSFVNNYVFVRFVRDLTTTTKKPLKEKVSDLDNIIKEITNPEELASASPFDYFLGAKEVDGKWVFKKMAPVEVASVVAGVLGISGVRIRKKVNSSSGAGSVTIFSNCSSGVVIFSADEGNMDGKADAIVHIISSSEIRTTYLNSNKDYAYQKFSISGGTLTVSNSGYGVCEFTAFHIY